MKEKKANDQESYERAKKRVEELKSFYSHLFVYLAVNAGLFLLNILTSPSHLWFYWPLIGWGIGLAIHGLSVFGTQKMLGKDWEERKIQELMEKEKK
ncbi:MAG: 2TM domain-containing protein [candidate division WOR-3 bacterium]|nr:2TM domain-containing protein [candidate division WOR-3 bacterium]